VPGDDVRILDGSSFVVSDRNGDIDASPADPAGLFVLDTRYLSKWILTINGKRLAALSVDDVHYFESRHFLVPGPAMHYTDATLSIIRHRWIGGSFGESLTVMNHGDEPVELSIVVFCGADFADIFDIKNDVEKQGDRYTSCESERLCLGYQREGFRREAIISARPSAKVDPDRLSWQIKLDAHQEWLVELKVDTRVLSPRGGDVRERLLHRSRRSMANELALWTAGAPRVECSWDSVTIACERSVADLAALQFSLFGTGDRLPAAGLPWFMAMFGRDSIFTSLQALPIVPGVAKAALRALASLQGTKIDDFRDEEPGKILHELRFGESAAFGDQPHSPYYGTADATPLFIVLLDEYERWTGDRELVVELAPEAKAALDWIGTYGDVLNSGYVGYSSRNSDTGLINQCWKDSWDSVSRADGSLPDPPRITCELQGYAYDAKVRGARLARTVWGNADLADRLDQEAAELRERFNRDFWVADGEYFAIGLDRDGNQLQVLSSNIGHLLWSGIVDENKASALANHLLGPRLFNGWGVRTLATGERRYNPIGYHNGTVWPFDTSIIAWGLRRYGFPGHAARLAQAMFEAATYFGGRLPEAFAGYPRQLTGHPVEYPTACSPQAWSTGTPLLFIRTLLGLESIGDHLVTSPELPPRIEYLALVGVPGRWGKRDAFARRPTPRSWRPGRG
jgi:glycogen debranching enzyme